MFGVQALALIDTKFPVWYPYFVPWFIAIFVEAALLVVPNVFDHPKSVFDFIFIAIQAVRITTFIVLTSLYFGLRNDEKQYDNYDAERQSLLRKKLAPKQGSEDSSKAGKGYGATTTENGASETADDASEAGSEDSWLAERRKAQEKVAKRLKQDGNWFTYAKGFAVSKIMLSLLVHPNISSRSSFLIFGQSMIRFFNSELFWLECVCWPRMR